MRLTTKFSAFFALLTGLAILVTLMGAALSFYIAIEHKVASRVKVVATLIDNELLLKPPTQLQPQLKALMVPVDIIHLEIWSDDKILFSQVNDLGYHPAGVNPRARSMAVPLVKHPGMTVTLTWLDPIANYYRSIASTAPLSGGIVFMVLMVLASIHWVKRQLKGQELLEKRALDILNGSRGTAAHGNNQEWPLRTSRAMDLLLDELQEAGERRSRVDTLIRAYAAQDARTGLHNRMFFDNQLATLLEDGERVGAYGVVMLVRLPEFDTLYDTWGTGPVDDFQANLTNLLVTFVSRYPGALLARYYRNDVAILLPHRTLKEADSIASQLLKALDTLPSTRMLSDDDIMHIGICTWRSGQSVDQVMDHASEATRNAELQGGNSWAVYDNNMPEKGRGNVRWRTMIEQALARGGPRFYQKPAILHDGMVHHREILCRIPDGDQEVIAAEYLPMVQQFGLSEKYDRQVIVRLIPMLALWPEETFAIPVSVESLCQSRFQRWLRDVIMECDKSTRNRILFELDEAGVCQHSDQLQRIVKLIKALGARVAVNQAGLTVVSTAYIGQLEVELIKLHAGLVRNIDKRMENLLFVQSLVEACNNTETQVFASGVRSRREWQSLMDRGVIGAQGDFIASSQALDIKVKKYSQRYSV